MTRRSPVAVALTGGIGAGKSEALRSFARHGAAVVSSDEIVHRLLRTDDRVKAALGERWGERIIGDDGEIDRGRIAEIVFADRAELEWLEAELHPRVALEYLRWRQELAELDEPPPVCATEVPLLYEVGGDERFDKVVVITAPRRLREARSQVRRDDREQRLLPDREKIQRADYSYVNTGTIEELDAWIAGVMRELAG